MTCASTGSLLSLGMSPRSSSCRTRLGTACDARRGSEPAAARLGHCWHSRAHTGCPNTPQRPKHPGKAVCHREWHRQGTQTHSFPGGHPNTGHCCAPLLGTAGARQDTLDQLHHPGHAQGSINLMEQLRTGLWAGTDPCKEHLPSPNPRTPGCVTQDQAEMIACRRKSTSHIWQAGDDSAAKPAAVSKGVFL